MPGATITSTTSRPSAPVTPITLVSTTPEVAVLLRRVAALSYHEKLAIAVAICRIADGDAVEDVICSHFSPGCAQDAAS